MILRTTEDGHNEYSSFLENRLEGDSKMFHDPIKRRTVSVFHGKARKVKVEKNGKTKILEVNRNFLSFLLALSAKYGKNIDFQRAPKYPLCAVPLSLRDADGSRRSTMKSKLNEVLMENSKQFQNEELPSKANVSVYIVDLMALARTMTKIPETYEELAIQLFNMILSGYRRVDIVVDSYIENSIKETERTGRGTAQKGIIQSMKSKVPRNFNAFLCNSENETRLISLIREVLMKRRVEILRSLKCQAICISTYNLCELPDDTNCIELPELSSDQEEADTKICLHAINVLNEDPNKSVIIRSQSGSVDINVLLTSLIIDSADRVFLVVNTGKTERYYVYQM